MCYCLGCFMHETVRRPVDRWNESAILEGHRPGAFALPQSIHVIPSSLRELLSRWLESANGVGLHHHVLLGQARVWKRACPGGIVLILGVAAVWLAIAGVIVVAVPVPEQSTMPSPAYSIGELAHLRA